MAEVTVVFADLTGSTGVFESLGNAKATQAITRLTQWIGKVCMAQHGKVVKNLGDGVLMVFMRSTDAVEAVTEMQRVHADRIKNWPDKLKMRLQVGMARGEVIEQDDDFFGDAVNVASRLSDLSGPDQILTTDAVIKQLPSDSLVRFRSLGAMDIRGRHEACMVYRVEWQNEVLSDFFTVPASLNTLPFAPSVPQLGSIALSWLDVDASFTSEDLPVHLGRVSEAQFVVNDPRVSRLHARIVWRAGKFYLEDVSSYGTWVRFAGGDAIIALRRQECVLLVEGEIALGAPFEDFTVPTVSFKFPLDGARLRG
ncbi:MULTISPECIES: adenylate/guanylate cyclase domain-containing protein [Polaromonas]|uniref:Adenylate/guanylate cyclase domain-containing protein n=1 Tax=Polaromonas aquatica TaxID=332657 RepID=A0ABW1TVH7_9BURK